MSESLTVNDRYWIDNGTSMVELWGASETIEQSFSAPLTNRPRVGKKFNYIRPNMLEGEFTVSNYTGEDDDYVGNPDFLEQVANSSTLCTVAYHNTGETEVEVGYYRLSEITDNTGDAPLALDGTAMRHGHDYLGDKIEAGSHAFVAGQAFAVIITDTTGSASESHTLTANDGTNDFTSSIPNRPGVWVVEPTHSGAKLGSGSVTVSWTEANSTTAVEMIALVSPIRFAERA